MGDYYETSIDRQIREARERGEFDNLPGTGKPLNLGRPNDRDWWIKGLMHREQLDMTGALPPAIALRKEVEQLPVTLADVRTEQAVREIIDDLNRRIRDDRLRPSSGPQILVKTVDLDDALVRWRDAR